MKIDPRIIITIYTNTTTSGINMEKVFEFTEYIMDNGGPVMPIGMYALMKSPHIFKYLEEQIPQVKLLKKWDPDNQSLEDWEEECLTILGDIELAENSFHMDPKEANWEALDELPAKFKLTPSG